MSLHLLLNSVIDHKRFIIQIKVLGENVFKLVALCALEINVNRHKLIILTYGCSFAFVVLQECMNSWRKLIFSFIPSPSFNNVRDGTEEILSGLCSTFIIGKMLPVSKTVKRNNYYNTARTCFCRAQLILHNQVTVELLQMLVYYLTLVPLMVGQRA